MKDRTFEWLKQADYDFNTAEYMFNGSRYFYAVFMCHLSIEKALKGLYLKTKKQVPPKIHNLVYFLNNLDLTPPENITKFIIRLNEASVVTRYPEDLDKISKDYSKEVVRGIINNTSETLKWIKKLY